MNAFVKVTLHVSISKRRVQWTFVIANVTSNKFFANISFLIVLSIPQVSLVNLTVFKETQNLVPDHFGKLGSKYISTNFYMIFFAF